MTSAIIIGGGIAGLSTALALKNAGIGATVFERAPAIAELGAGLTLWSNAVNALGELGVRREILASASILRKTVSLMLSSGRGGSIDLEKLAHRFGAPSICIHRGRLQLILLGALGEENVRTGCACIHAEQAGNRVRVHFENGADAEADFLVAADGIRSGIRRQLHPHAVIRHAGYLSWRGIARKSEVDPPPAGQNVTFFGAGSQAAVLECGTDYLFWYVTRNGPPKPSASASERKAEITRLIQGWPKALTRCIEATPPESILETDILDLPPLSTWGAGRTTFAGDAIHATTPNLGQGAGMGIEDGVVLGRCFSAGRDVEECLRDYERRRKPRTDWIVRESFRIGRVLQMENRLAVKLRDALSTTPLARWFGERMFARMMKFE